MVYYRDTFGLDPIEREKRMTESGAEGSDNDSIVTKSTGAQRKPASAIVKTNNFSSNNDEYPAVHDVREHGLEVH